VQVLKDLLTARQELATILGYARYADLATADQMIGSAANVERLIQQVDDASRPVAALEYAQLLAFAQQKQPASLPSATRTHAIGTNSTGARSTALTRRARAPTSPMTRCRRNPENSCPPLPSVVQAGQRRRGVGPLS